MTGFKLWCQNWRRLFRPAECADFIRSHPLVLPSVAIVLVVAATYLAVGSGSSELDESAPDDFLAEFDDKIDLKKPTKDDLDSSSAIEKSETADLAEGSEGGPLLMGPRLNASSAGPSLGGETIPAWHQGGPSRNHDIQSTAFESQAARNGRNFEVAEGTNRETSPVVWLTGSIEDAADASQVSGSRRAAPTAYVRTAELPPADAIPAAQY